MRSAHLLTIIALALSIAAFGCKKKDGDQKKGDENTAAKAGDDRGKAAAGADRGQAPAGAARPDASGKIAIAVTRKGYTPNSIEAKAGQDLTLVFTRTEETECGRYVKVAGKGETAVELPLNKPVELKVKAPADGELKFTCGMDMMTGVITVSKS